MQLYYIPNEHNEMTPPFLFSTLGPICLLLLNQLLVCLDSTSWNFAVKLDGKLSGLEESHLP